MNAQRLSRTQAQTEAGIMRVQVERILREAWLGIDAMVPLLQVGCDQARPVLSRTMSTRPYFRSLTLFDGRQAYCSSLPSLPGGHSREWPWAIPPGRWLRLVNGSPFVLERPALLAGTAGPGERHAIAVIDSQYLQDLLDSVAALSNHRIELKIDGGMTLASCPARDLIYEPRAYGAQSASVSFMSQNVPVDIRIFSPASQV
ncbi:CSS-motif domain-containing protein [Bordetella holmesii]|nr:CSS-motif domain-containing protein [Bordetella holmesii]QGB07735.1 hypothetical protein FYB59_10080 [Bordetella holmesii]QGB15136.1 hypothetical protein FYB57_10080 [Bordetella holmesii]QGB64383.1 hypothetical protein FYB43_10080 [Bordetella holmesii]QGC42931.1 hypothetical protein FYB19_10090 [Bordetella holmesii]QGC62840.1 hypothetical protein FYB13_10080 [Bordetella holmesii]